ncbi:unnamed protein product [Diatraea saccharalis]|uniref:Uncharacterized protein n=1 Tax=Diatraea saccharalis TaxID=40085 RepID=A0A9N9R0E5_9NEOP|nr:unnamed protein product [Diatraea saccharalis]
MFKCSGVKSALVSGERRRGGGVLAADRALPPFSQFSRSGARTPHAVLARATRSWSGDMRGCVDRGPYGSGSTSHIGPPPRRHLLHLYGIIAPQKTHE